MSDTTERLSLSLFYLLDTAEGFPVGWVVKNLAAVKETQVLSQGQEDPPENGMATRSSVLAWRIPWTEKPGGPQSMGSQTDPTECLTRTDTAGGTGNMNRACESIQPSAEQSRQDPAHTRGERRTGL